MPIEPSKRTSDEAPTNATKTLLAIDLGLRTGMALFDDAAHLLWYRSHHYANNAALRRSAHRTLREIENLAVLYIEGGGALCDIWVREANKLEVHVRNIGAETWRSDLLYSRDQRSGKQAKRKAEDMARRVIEWSDAPRPTSLRHDTSEAILVGLWGLLDTGWLKAIPRELIG
ncbi:MAG TPA: hypothetical protein PKN33_03300 [Phycisphaerae bacterium]|nr:hypothetical protein [Phycisphaerae bacterium]